MKTTRKEFLKTGALLTGGFLLKGHSFFDLLSKPPAGFKKLRDNAGIYTERGGTIGWYVADDAVVIIDSQFPETAKNFWEGLKNETSRRIDFLFNTHHHYDHTAGNIFLKDFSHKIIAHKNCRALQEKNYGSDPQKPQAYANITFSNSWSEDLKNERITARYFGPAHTGGDSVIHFEKADIAHVGDLVFNRAFPFIDAEGGGSIKEWITVLERIEKFYSRSTLFIFGHAASDEFITGSISDVKEMKNYFEALVDFVWGGIKEGKNKDQIASAEAVPGFENLKERWQGARKMNLEAAYDELSKFK